MDFRHEKASKISSMICMIDLSFNKNVENIRSVVIDSGAIEPDLVNAGYLQNVEEIAPGTAKLVKGTTLTTRKLRTIRIDVRIKRTLKSRAYHMPEIKLALWSS